jgi:hypothetical protein
VFPLRTYFGSHAWTKSAGAKDPCFASALDLLGSTRLTSLGQSRGSIRASASKVFRFDRIGAANMFLKQITQNFIAYPIDCSLHESKNTSCPTMVKIGGRRGTTGHRAPASVCTSFHYLFAASCSVSSMLLSVQYPKLNGTVPCQGRKGLFSAIINPHHLPVLVWRSRRRKGSPGREERRKRSRLCSVRVSYPRMHVYLTPVYCQYLIATRSPHTGRQP